MGDYQQRERANEELAITENVINLENEGIMSKNNVNPEVPRESIIPKDSPVIYEASQYYCNNRLLALEP